MNSLKNAMDIISDTTLAEDKKVSVKTEGHGSFCVEIHDTKWGDLCWRKRSYEPSFEEELKNILKSYTK